MGGRGPILVVWVVGMVMVIAIYLRHWTIDYRVSSVDSELIKRQFDIASRDAIDEAAEWRRKYDIELGRANGCAMKLAEENTVLLERVKVLSERLDAQKLKCRS